MAKKNEKEVAVINEETAMSYNPELLITKAIESNAPIEVMERLFNLAEKVNAVKAKQKFDKDFAEFQAECPVIEKKKIVLDKYGKERYRYAPLDSIVSQVKSPLARHGFSYHFEEIKDDKFVTAICTVTHTMGHSESSSFKVQIGTEEYMTDVQKYGARMTFAKRYAFCNALGILTGDEDTDANEDTDEVSKVPQEIKDQISQATNDKQLADIYNKNPLLRGKELMELLSQQKRFIISVEKEENANIS